MSASGLIVSSLSNRPCIISGSRRRIKLLRLTVHWLVPEDIFEGVLQNGKIRLEKGLAALNAVEKLYPEVEV